MVYSRRLAVIDTSTEVILIILLIVGTLIVNRIFHQRRRQLLGQIHTQGQGQGARNSDNYNNNLQVDMAKSERHSIISGFPVIQNKLKTEFLNSGCSKVVERAGLNWCPFCGINLEEDNFKG